MSGVVAAHPACGGASRAISRSAAAAGGAANRSRWSRALKLMDVTELLFRQGLQAKRAALGARHPSTLALMHHLASLLHDRGKLDEAEPLYLEVLRGSQEVLGR
jgi:hypothetical protein